MADTVGFHSYEASLRLICNYMRMSAHGLQQKKKRVVLNKTVQCFRGSDFVDTLARNANISRECSSMVGHKLVLEDYVKPVSEKSPEFRDDGSLFAFNLPLLDAAGTSLPDRVIRSGIIQAVGTVLEIPVTDLMASAAPTMPVNLGEVSREDSGPLSMSSDRGSATGSLGSVGMGVEFDDYFEEDSPDIKFNLNDKSQQYPKVKAATTEMLIVRLTHEKYPDVKFRDTFLLTYRSFMTPAQLLNQLIVRFEISAPIGFTPPQRDEFAATVKKTVQLRVMSVLKSWVESHIDDFLDAQDLRDNLLDQLRKTMERKMTAKKVTKCGREQTTTPLMIKDLVPGQFGLDDIATAELARQISLLEFELYSAVCAKECLGLAWSKKDKEKNAPKILAAIDQFNRTSRWVTYEIVHRVQLKSRVSALEKLIKLAEELLKLNNFNGVMEILSGINSSPVRRLKKTWEGIGEHWQGRMKRLEELMSHDQNYKSYRAALHNCDPPTIPYLGIYLTDLTFIEEGNKDKIDHLINFDKCYLTAAVISEIQQYQKIGYSHITSVAVLQEYLRGIDGLPEEETYECSMKVEPRKQWEALETLLMEEEKLRDQLRYAQLRIADLEASNKRYQSQVNSLTTELRKWRRLSVKPAGGMLGVRNGSPAPGGSALKKGWLGYSARDAAASQPKLRTMSLGMREEDGASKQPRVGPSALSKCPPESLRTRNRNGSKPTPLAPQEVPKRPHVTKITITEAREPAVAPAAPRSITPLRRNASTGVINEGAARARPPVVPGDRCRPDASPVMRVGKLSPSRQDSPSPPVRGRGRGRGLNSPRARRGRGGASPSRRPLPPSPAQQRPATPGRAMGRSSSASEVEGNSSGGGTLAPVAEKPAAGPVPQHVTAAQRLSQNAEERLAVLREKLAARRKVALQRESG